MRKTVNKKYQVTQTAKQLTLRQRVSSGSCLGSHGLAVKVQAYSMWDTAITGTHRVSGTSSTALPFMLNQGVEKGTNNIQMNQLNSYSYTGV